MAHPMNRGIYRKKLSLESGSGLYSGSRKPFGTNISRSANNIRNSEFLEIWIRVHCCLGIQMQHGDKKTEAHHEGLFGR
jgi:hypothetical protein